MTLMLYLLLWLIKYTLEKIVLALHARQTDPPSGIWCAYGFVGPLGSPCLPRSGPTHWVRVSMLGNFLFSSGVPGHRQWKTELSTSS